MGSRVGNIETSEVSRFEPPLMEGMVVTETGAISTVRMPTAQSLEALQKEAYDEGFELGRKQGIESGQGEIAQRAQALNELIASLALPFKSLDEAVVNSIADLAVLVARQLIRRELKTEPGEIVAVVRECLQHLPVAARKPRVRMHPEDIDIVHTALGVGEDDRSWRLQPDPLVTRGGCVVETDTSRIDASVESRIAAIVAKMFGGEREGDRQDD